VAPELAAAAVAHFFGGDGGRLRPARQLGEEGEEEEGEESAGGCWVGLLGLGQRWLLRRRRRRLRLLGPGQGSRDKWADGRPRPGAAAGAGALDALLEQARLKARVMGHLPAETQR
jgi:hypothetical protein